MNRLTLSLLLIFFVTQSYSQKLGKDKQAYVDSLLELSCYSYAEMDIHHSLKQAMKAVSLSEDINYSKGKAWGNLHIAQALWRSTEYEKTIKHLQLAEQEPYLSNDLILISEICRLKGLTYGSLKLHDLSLIEFHKGLKHISEIETTVDREYLASLAYNNLASSYLSQNIADSALYYLNLNKQLLDYSTDKRLFKSRISLYAQLGKVYAGQEEYDLATSYFSQALETAEASKYPCTLWIYLQWGNMKRNQGQLNSAIVKYKEGLNNLKQINLQSELIDIYIALRNIYLQKGYSDSAFVYHQKVEAIEPDLTEANIKAVNMAIRTLLDNKKSRQATQLKKMRSIAFVILGAVIMLSIGLRIRWRKRYEKLSEKEEELKETLEEKIDSTLDEIIELAKQNDSSFLPRFMELFPRFTQQIYLRHPNLTRSSFLFCAYIFLHFSSKEIAEFLFIEHKSVQTRKNRLRKQLGLPQNTDLYQYMRWVETLENEPSTITNTTDDPDFL